VAAHRQPSYVTVARALLTGGAALALARVFAGASWVAPLVIAAVLPAAVFALAERRRWNELATLGTALAVGVWLAIFVDDPSETLAGIPTPSALAAAGHDLARAPHVLRSAVVPVHAAGAALMLAVVATFVAALVSELVARRLEAPVGAIGPSVALYVALSALGHGRWAPSTACYALVVVEYLVALQHAEVQTRRTWFQSTRNRRSQLVAGGVIAGTLVVAIAITLGPAVPGARGAAWIRYRSLGSGSGSSILNVTSPLVSVGAKLNQHNSNSQIFTVRTTEEKGDYWRVIALDQFQDDGWGLDSGRRAATKLPGATHAAGTALVSATFHLGAIDARWLPAAYRPINIDVPGSQVLPGSTSLFLDQPLAGLTYVVQSEISNPNKDVLEAVTFADLGEMSADAKIPDNFSPRARTYAQTLTAAAHTPYDKALALMSIFHKAPFVYDQTVDLGTNAHALDRFLFDTHRGFCEQYAAAFAELARAIGLPTRVAVGYQPGHADRDGLWHVSERDAHAWPEVWLGSTVGWYRFEPTPGRTDPVTHLGDAAASGTGGPTTTTPTTTAAGTTPTTASFTPNSTPDQVHVSTPAATTNSSRTRDHAIVAALIAVAIIVGVLVLMVGALALRVGRRTRRRRHDPDDRRRVLGAWTEAMERLSAAGIERRPSTTSLEFALRQAPALGAGAAGPPLMTLARLHTAAMYAAESPSPDDADDAWAEVDAIAAAVRTSVPRTRRWRARWRAEVLRRSAAPEREESDYDELSPVP
jgi:transglutaminase-like putative cysteine protease